MSGQAIEFRIQGTGIPPGEVDLRRLGEFCRRFRVAVLRSAQAELGVPASKRGLPSDEERPEFRLVGLEPGSSRLLLRPAIGATLALTVIGRHLQSIHEYEQTGTWGELTPLIERSAWSDVYETLLTDVDASAVVVKSGDRSARVDHVLRRALAEDVEERPEWIRAEVVGDLHQIRAKARREFRILSGDRELVFELDDQTLEMIDPFRWKRVLAEALVREGSNRARLLGIRESSDQDRYLEQPTAQECRAWSEALHERIGKLDALESGWYGSQSREIRKALIDEARRLVGQIASAVGGALVTEHAAPPFIAPDPGGGISFEWTVHGRSLLFDLLGGGKFETLVEEGEETRFEGVMRLRDLLVQVRWLVTGEGE